MIKVKVYVTLKEGILDPEGKTIQEALRSLEIARVKQVRSGKYFELIFPENHRESAEAEAKSACEKILSNPVIETYHYEIEEVK
jgi:phosphoribosylformylglycinamidine synthase